MWLFRGGGVGRAGRTRGGVGLQCVSARFGRGLWGGRGGCGGLGCFGVGWIRGY